MNSCFLSKKFAQWNDHRRILGAFLRKEIQESGSGHAQVESDGTKNNNHLCWACCTRKCTFTLRSSYRDFTSYIKYLDSMSLSSQTTMHLHEFPREVTLGVFELMITHFSCLPQATKLIYMEQAEVIILVCSLFVMLSCLVRD